MMDGKLLLVTNAPELTPEEVVQRYALSCAAGYNLRWLLRAIVRLGLGPVFLRRLRQALWGVRAVGASPSAHGPAWALA